MWHSIILKQSSPIIFGVVYTVPPPKAFQCYIRCQYVKVEGSGDARPQKQISDSFNSG